MATGFSRLLTKDAPAGAGELVIGVQACGECGTDMLILGGEFPATPGIALGHEYAGIVREVGEEVAGFQRGDHVAVDPNTAYGRCPACQRATFTSATSSR